MSSYGFLASYYDALTEDVAYGDFADLYEGEFKRDGGEFRLLLDLCCGTGSLTWELARRGYDMIGVDLSADMLSQAAAKQAETDRSPLFLCQDAARLDLYGTVDAALCSLDGMNYIPPASLPAVFRRLGLFIRPGGLLIFDLRTPEFLRGLDGQVFVDEREGLLCLWRAEYVPEDNALAYGMDVFTREKVNWARHSEEHVEYLYQPEALKAQLEDAGFSDVRLRRDGPQGNDGRIFICARR